jgi:glycosyltransferase involved in cell wall biosynthesis
MKRKVVVSVINDLVSDQRVHKSCITLVNNGWEVHLVGRLLKNSLDLPNRPYKSHRMKLLFSTGPLFYAEYNIRLFLLLIFSNAYVFHSNDLDTLPANFLASKIKRKKLVYDSHEYFTEVPELVTRPFTQNIWRKIEGLILPRISEMFTVSEPIATLFRDKYKVKVRLLRNMPRLALTSSNKQFLGADFNLPNKKIILLQGAGINIDRGMEELIESMLFVENAVLVIAGSGDVIPLLKQQTINLNLQDKIIFFDKMPFEKLHGLTKLSYMGCSLDEATNINYELSLPNKLFDYIHAGVPILATNLVEVEKIIKKFNVGFIIKDISPKNIATSINSLLNDEVKREEYHQNCLKARLELNWENEEKELISCYNSFESSGKL